MLPVECDITDQARVDAAFERVEAELGSVGVLVANAGVTKDTLLARMSDADWDAVIDTNLTGTFRVVRRAVRPMTRARFGRIILISSVVGLLGSPGQVNYAASKSALIGMARSLTRELGGRNITANVITPGFIETDMTAALDEKVVEGYRERIPAARLGQAEDVAGAALFLALCPTPSVTPGITSCLAFGLGRCGGVGVAKCWFLRGAHAGDSTCLGVPNWKKCLLGRGWRR